MGFPQRTSIKTYFILARSLSTPLEWLLLWIGIVWLKTGFYDVPQALHESAEQCLWTHTNLNCNHQFLATAHVLGCCALQQSAHVVGCETNSS